MLAVHQGTKNRYKVEELLGSKATLRDLETQDLRRIGVDQLNGNFFVYRNHEELPEGIIPSREVELEGIPNLVKEVILEDKWIKLYGSEPLVTTIRKKKRIKIKAEEDTKETTTEKGDKKNKQTKIGKVEKTTLKDICGDLDLDPGVARRKLRKSGITMSGRWEWSDPQEIEKVKKILEKS